MKESRFQETSFRLRSESRRVFEYDLISRLASTYFHTLGNGSIKDVAAKSFRYRIVSRYRDQSRNAERSNAESVTVHCSSTVSSFDLSSPLSQLFCYPASKHSSKAVQRRERLHPDRCVASPRSFSLRTMRCMGYNHGSAVSFGTAEGHSYVMPFQVANRVCESAGMPGF